MKWRIVLASLVLLLMVLGCVSAYQIVGVYTEVSGGQVSDLTDRGNLIDGDYDTMYEWLDYVEGEGSGGDNSNEWCYILFEFNDVVEITEIYECGEGTMGDGSHNNYEISADGETWTVMYNEYTGEGGVEEETGESNADGYTIYRITPNGDTEWVGKYVRAWVYETYWSGEDYHYRMYEIKFVSNETAGGEGGGEGEAGGEELSITLKGRVFDAVYGNVLSGVTVSAGGVSATTGDDGSYSLSFTTTGSVEVTASRAGYEDYSRTLEFEASGTYIHDIYMIPTGSASYSSGNGSIYGLVYDAESGEAIAYATVYLSDGDNTTEVFTSESGYYEFEDLEPGDYEVWADKIGYYTSQRFTVTVSADTAVRQDIALVSESGSAVPTPTPAPSEPVGEGYHEAVESTFRELYKVVPSLFMLSLIHI